MSMYINKHLRNSSLQSPTTLQLQLVISIDQQMLRYYLFC